MKSLSLRQPWAELILQGKKTIETRKWNTSFRGEFLIHASLQVDQESMKAFGFDTLPAGGIVGKAVLDRVVEYPTVESFNADQPKHLAMVRPASWKKKRFGFVLSVVERVPFVPLKGKLNFFEVKGNL